MEQPQAKSDEKNPLLKMENGSDVGVRQPPTPTVTRGLKRILFERWPEIMSGYWMTIVMIVATCLICYSLVMGYSTQPLFLKTYDSKPNGDVHIFHIIQRRCAFPFVIYSQFLSHMAHEYPSLRFNMFFLVDDSLKNPYHVSRNAVYFNELLGYASKDSFDESSKRQLRRFEKKHPNVNFTIMCLSMFMEMTPLRFKWKTIPLSHLSFYSRVYAVWKFGGIGMDLTAFNNRFSNNLHLDRRIHTILQNHNDGLPETDYNALLSVIDKQQLSCIRHLKNHIIDEIFASLNKVLGVSTIQDITTDVLNPALVKNATNEAHDKLSVKNTTSAESFSSSKKSDVKQNLNFETLAGNMSKSNQINTTGPNLTLDLFSYTVTQGGDRKFGRKPFDNDENNKTDSSDSDGSVVLFYDISLVTDYFGQPLLAPVMSPTFENHENKTKKAAYLALDPDGIFIASIYKLHPFLGMILSAGLKRSQPEFAIQDALISQCSGVLKYESYCSIYSL